MRWRHARSQRRVWRDGITLLEIVLALALMAIAASLLAQLVALGARAAHATRDKSRTQLICESVMAEVKAGILLAEPVGWTTVESDPGWQYRIDVSAVSDTLDSVRVSVSGGTESSTVTNFSMTTWIAVPMDTTTDSATDGAAGGI